MSETQHREAAARWLNDADIGCKDYDTTQAPFGTASVAGMIDVTALPPPDSAYVAAVAAVARRARWPPLLRHAYGLVGDRATEFTLHGWTFMSLQKIQDRLALYARHGQTRVCDVAIYYEGMGHFRVLCIDTETGRWFQRLDGGANDWDRDHHWQLARQLDPGALAPRHLHAWDPRLPLHPHLVSTSTA